MLQLDLPPPMPEQVLAARKAAGLTQAEAAHLISPSSGDKGYRTWQRFECPIGHKDHRAIHPGQWELFLLLTDQHPELRLAKRKLPGRQSKGETRSDSPDCDYCNHPLFAGRKCKHCGKVHWKESTRG